MRRVQAALERRYDPQRPAPFRALALDYHSTGLKVFPAAGKVPQVSRFNEWPGLHRATVQAWAERWPNANLALGTRGAGLVVLDADDPALTAMFRDVAGDTPLKVLTPRGGEHWYYLDPSGTFDGVNGAGGLAFDIKGAGRGDLVLLPGSYSEEHHRYYDLTPELDCHVPTTFAMLLRDVPPLTDGAYRELALRPARTFRISPAIDAPVRRLAQGRSVTEGQRNDTLFAWCCKQAWGIARAASEGGGLEELTARALGLNSASFDPPLPPGEVAKTAKSAWKATLAGTNRRATRYRSPIGEALVQLGGDADALILRLFISQAFDVGGFHFSASRWASASVIPRWTRANYTAAMKSLQEAGEAKELVAGTRGRGRVGRWSLRPLASPMRVSVLLLRLCGDADAVALYLHVIETRDRAGMCTLAIRAMTAGFGGPFSKWSERRLRRARNTLVKVGLLAPVPVQRRPDGLHEPARFMVEPLSVLKMSEIAPLAIHPPPPGWRPSLMSARAKWAREVRRAADIIEALLSDATRVGHAGERTFVSTIVPTDVLREAYAFLDARDHGLDPSSEDIGDAADNVVHFRVRTGDRP